MPAKAQSLTGIPAIRVFFVAGDVAFASPSRGWPDAAVERGLRVRFWRERSGQRQPVAEGALFRVRPQHVAITLSPGSDVREGDLVTVVGDPGVNGAAPQGALLFQGQEVSPRAASSSLAPSGDVSGLRILVYNIIQAPRLVASSFDSHFREALREGAVPGGTAGGRVGVIIDSPERRRQGVPGPSEIRLQAMRHGADLVLVPVYVEGSPQDNVEVRVFDARTGNPAGVTSSPVRPVPSLVWTASGRRAGRLELVGRWSGVRPAASGAAVRRDGSVVVRIDGDLYTLKEGEAVVSRENLNVAASRRVSLGRRRPLVATVETIPFDEVVSAASPGGDRVVLYDGEDAVFRSGPMGVIAGLAVRDDLLVVLTGDAIELLRLHPD